ncbi:YcnI family copper-binding membrane protein [Rathayibacter soli]|uniref:YcnI family copper-binding membrane protein n=1 Tax=Rathayibacter soli TaxID=3144168 RepID=UPI0027E3C46C|nr:YcnI family protein [Glaciibacter superstes]
MKKITIIRTVATLGVASALALAAPLAASAHVRVTPDQATAGSYAVLTFRVPTESATASTVKLEVDFPTTTPFSTVSYQPIAGWQTVVTTEKLATPVKTATATITEAVSKVVWTADAASVIAPGQFQQFSVSAGPVPDTGSVMLPTHQTYSDGSVVDWNQPTPASGTEPQHPAPTLYINDALPSASGAATVATVATTPTADPTDAASGSSGSSDLQSAGVWVGLGGLALGAIALVVAVFALARQGRAAKAATGEHNDTGRDA